MVDHPRNSRTDQKSRKKLGVHATRGVFADWPLYPCGRAHGRKHRGKICWCVSKPPSRRYRKSDDQGQHHSLNCWAKNYLEPLLKCVSRPTVWGNPRFQKFWTSSSWQQGWTRPLRARGGGAQRTRPRATSGKRTNHPDALGSDTTGNTHPTPWPRQKRTPTSNFFDVHEASSLRTLAEPVEAVTAASTINHQLDAIVVEDAGIASARAETSLGILVLSTFFPLYSCLKSEKHFKYFKPTFFLWNGPAPRSGTSQAWGTPAG